jgi:hypothetical protein
VGTVSYWHGCFSELGLTGLYGSQRRLHVELVWRADSAEEFAPRAREWLTETKAELFGELDRRLPSDAVMRAPADSMLEVLGPPGATYATIHVRLKPFRPDSYGSSGVYSPRAWQRVLDRLQSAYPLEIRLWMMPLDAEGIMVKDERGTWSVDAGVGICRHEEDPRWVQFCIQASSQLVPWPESAEIQTAWVDFFERWAIRLDACYGHVTDDADDRGGTALEQAAYAAVGTYPPTIPRCREALRGYSWVTICAPELVGRLGGVAALAASGAFHEVRELPRGQALLRATPLVEEYEGAAVERAFRTLAPVLLPGRVDKMNAPALGRLVLGVDAADYR